MEEGHERIISEAVKSLKTADHLTYITYPVVKDNKLLIKIVENVYISLVMVMEGLLYYDRYYKRIGPFADNFDSRLDVFKNKVGRRYNFDREFIVLLLDLKKIIEDHKKSPMVFQRSDRVVICSDRYRMKTLNIDDVKHYIGKAKPFISKARNIVGIKT